VGERAQYYATIFMNQIVLSRAEAPLAPPPPLDGLSTQDEDEDE